MLAILAPALGAGDSENVPVATKIAGLLTVRSSNGASHEVGLLQPLRSGDVVTTGLASSSSLSLEGVAKIFLGSATAVQVFTPQGGLGIRQLSGTLCVEADGGLLAISTPILTISPAQTPTYFNASSDPTGTKIAVVDGAVTARTKVGNATLNSGEALIVGVDGSTHRGPIAMVAQTFAQCPFRQVAQNAQTPSPVAEPQPTVAPAGGGGGGGGAIGLLLGLLAIGAAAGHGGGGGGGSTPATPPPASPSPSPSPSASPSASPSPGILRVVPNTMTFDVGSSPQPFTASEPNYTGVLAATSENTNVATVTPARGTGPSQTFTVTPVHQGTTNIDVADDHLGGAAVSITVQSRGTLLVSPGALTLLAGGPAKTFDASESNYLGVIHAVSSDPNLATISPPSGNGPGPVTFTVTPIGAGNPSIVVTDDHGGSQQVALTITGPLTTDTRMLTFSGTTTPQQFHALDPNFTGTIRAMIDNSGVATVTPSGSGPNATFTVTPVAEGNATISLTDPNGGAASVSVAVTTGGLVLNPTNLAVRINGQRPFTAQEANYPGLFFAASSDTTLATVAPAQGNGPGPFTFTVTGVAAGNPVISVHDDHGDTRFVDVAVTGPLTANPNSLTFDGSSTNAQTFDANDPNNASTISATSANTNIATVAPPSGTGQNVTFTVTPLVAGSTNINLVDGQGATATVPVTINDGPLGLSTGSLLFTSPSASMQPFTATENFYTGQFNLSGCSGTVTVAPTVGNGPSQTFNVTPEAAGVCTLMVTDDHGGSRNVNITVYGVLQANPQSLTFTDIGSKTFVASEANYPGLIGQTGCAGVATVSPGSGSSPVTFTVTPVAAGTCTITVTDDHGGSVPVSITVGPFGAVTPSPSSLTFTDVGSANNQTFMVSESGYTGTFMIDGSPCAGAATVSPNTGNSGTTFTVTPVNSTAGCNINIRDSFGATAQVNVVVGPFGQVVPNPPTLTFNGPAQQQSSMASETNYTGSFSAADSGAHPCTTTNIATIQQTGSTFTVTSQGPGNCAFLISDDHGQSAELQIFVSAGNLTVIPATIGFADISTGPTPAPFTANDPGNVGPISAVSSNTAVATVVCRTLCLGTSAIFDVTPLTNGLSTITVTDLTGGQADVSVGVGQPPLMHKKRKAPPTRPLPIGRKPVPIATASPKPTTPPKSPIGGGPVPVNGVGGGTLSVSATSLMLGEPSDSRTITASEPGFMGPLGVTSSNPSIATATVAAAGPYVWNILISAHGAGTTTISVSDGRGAPHIIFVRVLEPEPRIHARPPLSL